MKTEFIQCSYYKAAKKQAPWAAIIVKVDGGYRAFESIDDYLTWRNQK